MIKIAMLAFCVAVVSNNAVSAQSPCAKPDTNSEHIIGILKNMMESDAAVARKKIGLPLVPVSEIVLVSDPAICARAGEAADSVVRIWSPGVKFTETPALYVIQVGSSYVVGDLSGPPNPNDEFQTVFVFGPLWRFRSLMAV